MKTIKIFGVTCALALSLTMQTQAQTVERGVAIQASQLSNTAHAELRSAVNKDRAKNPRAFRRVSDTAQHIIVLDRNKRGRFATITRQLNSLGKDALYPMLEMLALRAPTLGTPRSSAKTALRVSLIEAVGMLRDPAAIPILDVIVDQESEFWTRRAAVEALGRIGTDKSAKKLAQLAAKPGKARRAVLAGIGGCRRAVCVKGVAIATRSSNLSDVHLALRALGDMGSSWAWTTPAVRKSGEESTVRGTAARALIEAFAKHHRNKRLRIEIIKSLYMVDDPSAETLVEAQKSGASSALVRALDELKAKLRQNPKHKYRK